MGRISLQKLSYRLKLIRTHYEKDTGLYVLKKMIWILLGSKDW
jgi:hypothetical protein